MLLLDGVDIKALKAKSKISANTDKFIIWN
jgi:hypothetical protein